MAMFVQMPQLTVVAVLHDINMAARFCDRLLALRDGRLIAQGRPEQIMNGEVLSDIHGIPMDITAPPNGRDRLCFAY